MTIKDRIRGWLGITELLKSNATIITGNIVLYEDIKKIHGDLLNVYDANLRMRALIVEEFGKMQPASAAFIDAIFKENRDRLDIIMTVLDGFREVRR